MESHFDAAARSWDTPDKVARTERIAEAIAEVVPLDGASALDYGCGTGLLTWELAGRLGHVTLADVSTGMLEVARERAASDPGRFTVVRHDLTHAPLPHPVDLAYSAMALHHIPDTHAGLANLTASVRPGGWVALADLDADPDNHFHDDDFTGHRGIDRHALAADLAALGYTEVAERTVDRLVKTKNGVDHEHGVFLVTGRRPADIA